VNLDLPRPLHLALDCTPLLEARPTGVARGQRGWIDALLTAPHPIEMTLFVPGSGQVALPPGNLNHVNVHVVRLGPGARFRLTHLPRALGRLRPHLFHSPFLAIPLGTSVPVVATAHEVPEPASILAEGLGRTVRHRAWWAVARRAAQGLVAVSCHTARAARAAGWADRPLRVVHHGLVRTEELEPGALLPRQGPVLAVGTLRRKKGVRMALEAYGRVVADRAPACRPDLVWVGEGAPPARLPGGVRFPGYLPDEEVRALMQCASCLILPSITEGFGLPALEAMAAGCPVVVSAAGALPEVVGRAGWVVPRNAPGAWEEVLNRVLAGGPEVERRIRRGRKRAGRFNRARVAGRLLRLYAEVIQGLSS